MSDTPTPETDAALASYHRARWTTHRTSPCFDLMPADFARKLERERDEARSEANRWRYADLGDDGVTHPGDMFPWEEKP